MSTSWSTTPGFAWFGPSAKWPVNTLAQLFADNVQAPYLLVSVLAPKMVARGDGVIINVASRAGTVGQPDTAAYGATKAALASLARSWAAEYGPAGDPRQRHLTRTRLYQRCRPRSV